MVDKLERHRGLLNRSPRIVVQLNATGQSGVGQGPIPKSKTNHVRITFKGEACENFFNHYKAMIDGKEWQKTAKVHTPSEGKGSASARGSNAAQRGVGGISAVQRTMNEQTNRSNQSINQAFEDLSNLMEAAREMVTLSKAISEKLRAQQNGDNQNITQDETVAFKSYLLSLGVSDPVTKQSHGSGSSFFKELARELCTVLEPLMKENGGIMTLPEAYCRLNRARGVELISPEDLWRAAVQLNDMDLPLKVEKFSSGALVLQLSEFTLEATMLDTVTLVGDNESLSSEELAQLLNVGVLLANERLLTAEQYGRLCRDESIEGRRFYPNKFMNPPALENRESSEEEIDDEDEDSEEVDTAAVNDKHTVTGTQVPQSAQKSDL